MNCRCVAAKLFKRLSLHVSVLSNLNQFEPGVAEEVRRSAHPNAYAPYQQWVIKELEAALFDAAVAISFPEDGTALAKHCKNVLPNEISTQCELPQYNRMRKLLTSHRVLLAVKRNIGSTAMVLAFQLAIFNI